MSNSFGAQLKSRQSLIGTIVTLSDPQVAEILANSGFDWLFLDAEHAPLGARAIQQLLRAAQPKCPCAVRIPANEEAYIKQALDSGANGVIVPRVNDLAMAQQAVRYAKYHPLGERSVGIFTMDAGKVKSLADEGYTLIAVGMDTMMLGESAQRILDQTRG